MAKHLASGPREHSVIDEHDEFDQMSSPEYDDGLGSSHRKDQQNLINMYQRQIQEEENEDQDSRFQFVQQNNHALNMLDNVDAV